MPIYEVEVDGKIYEVDAASPDVLDKAVAEIRGISAAPLQSWKPPSDIPTPTPPEQLAAQKAAWESRPALQRSVEELRQRFFMGGAGDVRNVVNALPFAGQAALGAKALPAAAETTTRMLDIYTQNIPAINAGLNRGLQVAANIGNAPWQLGYETLKTGAKSALGLGTLGALGGAVDSIAGAAGLPNIGIVDWFRKFSTAVQGRPEEK